MPGRGRWDSITHSLFFFTGVEFVPRHRSLVVIDIVDARFPFQLTRETEESRRDDSTTVDRS